MRKYVCAGRMGDAWTLVEKQERGIRYGVDYLIYWHRLTVVSLGTPFQGHNYCQCKAVRGLRRKQAVTFSARPILQYRPTLQESSHFISGKYIWLCFDVSVHGRLQMGLV